MSDGVKVTFVMNLKPAVADQFCSIIPKMLPDTRAFPGCRSVNVFRNESDPNKVILIEEWDSKEDYHNYLAWRRKDNPNGMAELMATPTEPEYWQLVD